MKNYIQDQESFVNVPNGQIFVKVWTPETLSNPTPIILLHDSLGCIAMWRDFPELLCSKLDRQIIAYDRLGFGQSSAITEPASFDFIEREAEIYLPAVIQALNVKDYVLLGHSVGGSIAVVCASHAGKTCKAVITESSQAFVEDRTIQGIKNAEAEFKKPVVYAKLAKYHGEKAQWLLNNWIRIWCSPEYANWSLQKYLANVHCPVMAIHGDRDEYGSQKFPEVICEWAAGESRMQLISDCGHVPHREKTELVLNMIEDFLNF